MTYVLSSSSQLKYCGFDIEIQEFFTDKVSWSEMYLDFCKKKQKKTNKDASALNVKATMIRSVSVLWQFAALHTVLQEIVLFLGMNHCFNK